MLLAQRDMANAVKNIASGRVETTPTARGRSLPPEVLGASGRVETIYTKQRRILPTEVLGASWRLQEKLKDTLINC